MSGTNSVDLNKTPNKIGQCVIATFAAHDSTETFTYKNSYMIDVAAGEINAISLRDVGPSSRT